MTSEILKRFVDYLISCLDEVYGQDGDFCTGQTYALVDALEELSVLLTEKQREAAGLNYPVEERYPLPV